MKTEIKKAIEKVCDISPEHELYMMCIGAKSLQNKGKDYIIKNLGNDYYKHHLEVIKAFNLIMNMTDFEIFLNDKSVLKDILFKEFSQINNLLLKKAIN
jgi:hypothetical protein